MPCISSISCCFPCFPTKDQQETEFSKLARAAVAINGIIAVAIGLFILTRCSQLGAGLGVLCGGISLTFVAALIKCVKNTQKPTKLVVHTLSEIFPEPIVRNFLRFAKPRDLAYCAQVSKKWKALIDENTWKQAWQNDPNIVYDFQPLVDKGLLTWSKVGSYVHFSSFLRHINANHNHKVVFASSGAYKFWVENSQIYMQEKGSAVSSVLFKASGIYITRLATEGHFLFALGFDGRVLQLNYQTGQIVQDIMTSYQKNEGGIWHEIKKEGYGPCESKSFHVEEGYIVLKYGSCLHNLFEVISYQSPKERMLVKDDARLVKDFLDIGCEKIFVCKEKVYILGRNHIYIWDIKKKQKHACLRIENDGTQFLWDAILRNHFLYSASTRKRTVYETDLSTGTTKTLLDSCLYDPLTVSNKFLYGFEKYIHIHNLHDGKTSSKINGLVDPNTHELDPNLLERLIKNEQKPTEINSGF